jgi:hypothetical protein
MRPLPHLSTGHCVIASKLPVVERGCDPQEQVRYGILDICSQVVNVAAPSELVNGQAPVKVRLLFRFGAQLRDMPLLLAPRLCSLSRFTRNGKPGLLSRGPSLTRRRWICRRKNSLGDSGMAQYNLATQALLS